MAKTAASGAKGPMAYRSDYGMSARMQSNLRLSQSTQMDSAQFRSKCESEGYSSCYEKAGSVGTDPAKKEVHPVSASNSQVSKSAAAGVRSAFA